MINDELKALLREKAKKVDTLHLTESPESNKPESFDIKASLALVRQSILNEYDEKNNKVLYYNYQDSLEIKLNQSVFELLMYNLFLLQNSLQENNMIKVTYHKEADNDVINIRNVYIVQWINNMTDNNINLESIKNNNYMQEANKYAKILGISVHIHENLNKGSSIDIKLK